MPRYKDQLAVERKVADLLAAGKTFSEIEREAGVSRPFISKVKKRLRSEGVTEGPAAESLRAPPPGNGEPHRLVLDKPEAPPKARKAIEADPSTGPANASKPANEEKPPKRRGGTWVL